MFESHAIVELMGHARIAGMVIETTVFGVAMLRVDVPKTSVREGYTKYYSAGAVYCITPTDETTAQLAAERFNEPAIQPYILPDNPQLASKVVGSYDPELHDDFTDIDDEAYEPDYEFQDDEDLF